MNDSMNEGETVRISGHISPTPTDASLPTKQAVPDLPTVKKLSIPYTLPSRGVYYGDALPGGEVVISPIMGEQEEILSGIGDSGTAKKTLEHIISQLVDMRGFPIKKLLVGDYAALVMNVMAFSYDPYITATTQCPACKKNNQFHKPVSELDCTELTSEITNDANNFKVTLESVEAVIHFRSLTLEDADVIERFARSHRAEAEALGSRPEYLYTFVRHIVAVDGTDSSAWGESKLRQWLSTLTGKDMARFRAALNKVEPGYNMRPTMSCNHCGHEYAIPLPEVSQFFRSKSAKARSA